MKAEIIITKSNKWEYYLMCTAKVPERDALFIQRWHVTGNKKAEPDKETAYKEMLHLISHSFKIILEDYIKFTENK